MAVGSGQALKQRSGRAKGARSEDRAPTITTDLWPHGLTAAGREMCVCALPAGATVAHLVAREWPRPHDALAVAVDGRPVPVAAWGETPLRGGEIVTLRAVLAGGDDGKNPLRTVLQIGLLVAAIVVPPLLFTATWAQALTGAAITIAGGLIVNALAPPRIAEPAALPRPGGAAAKPLYNLTGGANRARPYEPLLLVLGTHRVFPDLGATEYTEIVGGEHYLHQIFHFGLGDLAIDDLRIGETALDSYEEVETEFGDAQGRIALVAGNVDSIAGGALADTGFVERTTAAGTRRIGIDLAGRLFRVADDGTIEGHSVGIEIEWQAADGGPVERRALTLTHASQTPYRRTLAYDLGAARAWTVRVRRTAEPADTDRTYDALSWAALRAYQADTGDYIGQTRLGLRIRATGQLSGRLDRVSAMVRQRVPTWDGAAWTAPRPSSNPAWLFRWYARGLRSDGLRLVAGVGLPDARIDETSIVAWGQWCAARGLGCNLVLDRAISHAEVLTLIAQCGRASPTWQTGRLGVVWEDEGRPATALITPGNVVAGSFMLDYATGQAADEIAVRYIEPALDWQYSTLRRLAPGVAGPPATTATLTLHGVTDPVQAAVECNLQAARQLYHRRRLSWEMAAEGLSIARGDVVHITHSLIDGGGAGRLAGGTAGRVLLNRAVDPGDTGAHLLLRLADGTVHQTAATRPPGVAGETEALDLAEPLPAAPDADGASPLDTLWRLYDASGDPRASGATPPARARITAVEPASDRRVRFTAIDEVAAYHAAATADLSAPLPALAGRAPRVLGVAFAETLVRVGAGFAVEIEAVLTVAGDWRGGVLRAGVDGGPARTVARLVGGETEAHWLAPPTGALSLTATPGTEAAPSGAPFAAGHEIAGFLAPPGVPVNFLIDVLGDGTRRLRWTPPADVDLAGIVIRYAAQAAGQAPAWEDMTPLHEGHLTASPLETVEPAQGHWVFAARAVDTGGRLSAEDVRIVAELGPQRLGDALILRCPSAAGWPGTIAGAVRSDDGRDALESAGADTWDDLTTWDAWQSWTVGDGAQAAAEIVYVGEAVDLSATFDAALYWTADSVGDAAFEYRVAATEAALANAAWVAYTPGSTVAGRWLQLRWRVSGNGAEVLSIDHLCWSVHAPAAERKLLDQDTAGWEGSAADGRIVPVDLRLVTDISLTLQSVGAGWSWTLVNKNNPTRIKIFDGAGDPADAVVDAVVRGIAA